MHTIIKAENEAQYLYKKACIQYEQQMWGYAVENLEKILQMDASYFEAANLLGKIYSEHYKNNDRALHYFLDSLAVNDVQPHIHLEVGKLYYFFNEYERAKAHLQKAIMQQHDLVYAHYYLACVYAQQGNDDAVARHSALCSNITQKQRQLELEKAENAKKNNNIDVAIVHYKKIIAINPLDNNACMELVRLYRIQNTIGSAIEVLEKFSQVYPRDTDMLLTLAHLYMEYKHPKRRSYYIAQAIKLCKSIITIDSTKCGAYALLHEIYAQLGDVILRDTYAQKYDQCVGR